MKSLLIPACCAVALASAAELKDPSEVALDWHRTVVEAKQSTKATLVPGQAAAAAKSPSQTFDVGFDKPVVIERRRPRVPLYDAPNYRNRGVLPTDRPRGAKPWEYNGETYWLVPLAPSRTL